ncbi:MAG: helix-turn-helix transcriptional regulator [Rickettsiales bacterium]|nr:helix-turn-helix transcriptional regulator [Rickettsiales bacterium]
MNEEEKINKLIGEKIVIFRKTRQLSRIKLSKILNISQQQLNKYEKGTNRISAAKLAIISEKFQCDVGYFYNGILDINIKASNKTKENLNTLISYFLNIKKNERKCLIISLTKEMTEK